jgi:hypothetical protein
MGMRCKVCGHAEVEAIDRALIEGKTLREIAEQWGFTASSVHRHKVRDLSEKVKRGKELQADEEASGLVERLAELTRETREITREALRKRDWGLALRSIARKEKQVAMEWKLVGPQEEVEEAEEVRKEWWGLWQDLVQTLERYPDAHAAVLEMLNGRHERFKPAA